MLSSGQINEDSKDDVDPDAEYHRCDDDEEVLDDKIDDVVGIYFGG